MSSADFGQTGVDVSQIAAEGGAVLDNIGIAIVNVDPKSAGVLALDTGENSAILAIEPEGIMYAFGDIPNISLDYLRGFRDAADSIYTRASQGLTESIEAEVAAAFNDTTSLTWGLQATKVAESRFSGNGIKVAILDTGLTGIRC